ncbi:MAG: lytic transglycosylase domain-containing protein [Vicinamibacterales bacterium]
MKTSAALVTIALLGTTLTAQAPAGEDRPSFSQWLDGVRNEALSRGIRREVVDQALADVEEPLPVVIERDRTQAETVLTLEQYLKRQITPTRLRTGREMLARHNAELDKVARAYGVPARVIAGIWGMESNFGRFSGVRPTVPALATLAWDPRRATYFRRELFNALEILNRGDIDVELMRGSWAGAMGQPQFMPSSYLAFAEDFDGDGRRDIWTTPTDVFASIANYLKGHGWLPSGTWGREVRVSRAAAARIAKQVGLREGSCRAKRDMSTAIPLGEWQRLGVRTTSGGALPKVDIAASLVSGTSRHFLVYANYDALLDYNCAHAYALGVGLLADQLTASTESGRRR